VYVDKIIIFLFYWNLTFVLSLLRRERKSRYNLDLPLDEVSVGDHLRDGMFHLKTCVHLHEIELLVHVHYELYRACKSAQNNGTQHPHVLFCSFGQRSTILIFVLCITVCCMHA